MSIEPTEIIGIKKSASSFQDYPGGIITADQDIKKAIQRAEKFAARRMPVLLTGETGTGKELFAHLVHTFFSNSRHNLMTSEALSRFVPVNCGAIPTEIFESEIFGCEKGAFTGAASRIGYAERADKGTLFLDEIADLPHASQVKLLRALDGNGFQKVGGSKLIKPEFQLVAATNQDLGKLVQDRLFRQDLYMRIKVAHIHIKPLRERTKDIVLLAEHFLCTICKDGEKKFSSAAKDRMENHPWPGNVRELYNAIRRGEALSEGNKVIEAEDLEI